MEMIIYAAVVVTGFYLSLPVIHWKRSVWG